MQEIKVWKLATSSDQKTKAEAIGAITETVTEQLLEDALTTSPELLMPDLILVGRQNETTGGPLDLLGVDEDGRLVVFELKRGNLTRDAVAQAIDYASYLAELEPEDLSRHVSENSGKGGTDKIDDFGQWYQSHFQHPVAEIGIPRVMLVGLGVDERAKRMVSFLAKCDLDISLITFSGFKLGGETLLARQVEVQSRPPSAGVKSTKLENQGKLDKLLATLDLKQNYEALVAATKKGLGSSGYQWPNPTGYSFYLPEVSASGGPTNRSYLALYAPENKNGKVQILLQTRAVEVVQAENIEKLAKAMGTSFAANSAGGGEIWIDGRKPASDYAQPLTELAQAVLAGWKTKMESKSKAELEEVPQSPQTVQTSPQ